jgi:hypothetical protein
VTLHLQILARFANASAVIDRQWQLFGFVDGDFHWLAGVRPETIEYKWLEA